MHPTLLHSQNHLMKILMSEEQKTLINNFVSQCVSLYEWIINRARISAGCNNMVQLVLVFNTRFSVHWAFWTSTSDILWVYAAFLSRNARLCAWFIDTIKIDNPSDWGFFSNYLCFSDVRELPWPERSLVYLDYSKCGYNVPALHVVALWCAFLHWNEPGTLSDDSTDLVE